jgi:2-oxoglutarate dehydrogenase E2 component (dihydrolipoamide succinyltransferase)
MPAVAVTVPSVGESITEGILSRWLKSDGSAVEAGEPLFELETDKASSNVPAPESGTLRITVAEGETVPIGATVATIDPSESPAAGASPRESSPAPRPAARDRGARAAGAEKLSGTTAEAAAAEEAAGTAPAAAAAEKAADAPTAAGAERPMSPAVRRLVSEQGVDVARVTGTGPGGRITKGDVLAFLETPQAQAAPAAATPAPAAKAVSTTAPAEGTTAAAAAPRETRQRMSGLRLRIAQRLVEVQQTAAILTTFNEADLSRVIELRALYKEAFQKKNGIGLGFMSFFVKAAIEALKAFPVVNARIEGHEIVYQNYHDIGVAVSTDRGLMVPIIRDADRLSFAAIEQAIAGFATKAREGTISVDDLRGGTFTITNGGIFGSLLSTPILNPPQSAILGMHAIKKRPVVVDDQIVVRPMMYLAVSYDHRLIDGREAVSFLVRVKECLENPDRMLIEI